MRALRAFVLALVPLACRPAPVAPPVEPAPIAAAPGACGGKPMRVHFYDVGQALAALVDLPDGRHVLVDTGEAAHRAGCGESCASANEHLLSKLERDLAGAPIDLVWITHPHSDHVGGAPDVLAHFAVKVYADNGRDLQKKQIEHAREAAAKHGAAIVAIDPAHRASPLQPSKDVALTPVVPSAWSSGCESDANDCSIALRVDYCRSSVLFVGDAEAEEETKLDAHGPVTLLQVGHHGSDTSTSDAFLARVAPKYAVISSGKEGEGMNSTFCHPRASTVAKLAHALGGDLDRKVHAFDAAVPCKGATPEHWRDVPAPRTLFVTARDGDVTLVTTGDGAFVRE